MSYGLYNKYTVVNNEKYETVKNVFVLKPEKDPHARAALAAYADSVRDENGSLADDLDYWLNSMVMDA